MIGLIGRVWARELSEEQKEIRLNKLPGVIGECHGKPLWSRDLSQPKEKIAELIFSAEKGASRLARDEAGWKSG